MRRFVAFAALMFMAPLAACQAPAPEAGPLSEEDVAAITASADVFGEATLAGDWAAYAALYTEDAVAILPNGVVVEGRAAIQALLEPLPPISQYDVTIVQIDGRGDLAFVRAAYSETYVVEGTPEPIHGAGKYVQTWRKQPDGKWLISLDISVLDSPLPD
jgi:uncharacterized protein (TIGR02246 family)